MSIAQYPAQKLADVSRVAIPDTPVFDNEHRLAEALPKRKARAKSS